MQKMTSNRFRWAWWLLAYASLGLGLVGVVVPGLPTVPFVLLSAYAAARGSERLHRWLLAHRVFGPMIVDWQVHGAVSRRAKRRATLATAAGGRAAEGRVGDEGVSKGKCRWWTKPKK